jgi:hypothetical protein
VADHDLPRAPPRLARRSYAQRKPRYGLTLDSEPLTALGDYVRERVGTIRGAGTAAKLLQGALAPTTYGQYGRLFADFAEYCELEGVSALPADRWTVVCYVGHIADLGTWAAGSLQPIFSAINEAHRSLDLEPPAVGSYFLKRVRQGLQRAQVALPGGTRDSRVPLPAEAVIAVIADGEVASEHELERLRGSAAIALTSIFAGRQDSAVHLRTQDFGFDQQFIWLRLTEKGKKHHVVRRIVRLPLSQRAVAGHPSALPRVAALLRRYCDARTAAVGGGEVPEFLFQLPGESRPTTRHMEGWLAAALQRLQVTAPEGFAYQGHSLRSMGASSMAAIGVDRHLLNWLGGWARGSSTVEVHYIDPTVLPSPAAYQLYGWALTRQFEADAGVVCRAEVLPDPLLEV